LQSACFAIINLPQYQTAIAKKPVIAIVGAGRNVEPSVSNARELGRLIAENGWVLITGGRDAGVMKAANEGAKEAKDSMTIGILPNRDADVSPSVDVAIVTDTGEARNNIIVLSADVVVACGVEDPGTASEVALAIKNGKPVILLDANETAINFFTGIGGNKIHLVHSPEEVIQKVKTILVRLNSSIFE
jgi:uncharacterized protein (TIGR00725 family)